MMKYLLPLVFALPAFSQQYKLESITTAAPDLPAAYAAVIDSAGYRVEGPKGIWCEIWFRKAIPQSAKPDDATIAFPIAQGTLLGVLRFPGNGQDRRGQQIKGGVYTMRYSNFRVDGAHQGVAAALPDFMKLVEQSRTSGTPHPAVFSLQLPTGEKFPALTKEGDHDVLLQVKVGNLGIGLIVIGQAEG
jgi:hypothetical protein